MLIGHYGVALGLKQVEPHASLGELFVAVQLSDILFFPLVAADVERGSIVPGLTAASDLRLDYAPYTHGLIGMLAISLIVFLIYQLLPKREGTTKKRLGLVMAGAAFSHYLLDVIVHTADMAIVNGGVRHIGLGLWDSVWGTYIVEAMIVLAGFWLYQRATESRNTIGKYGIPVFVVIMLLFNIFNLQPTSDEPSNLDNLVVPGVALLLAVAAAGYWLDRQRVPVEQRQEHYIAVKST